MTAVDVRDELVNAVHRVEGYRRFLLKGGQGPRQTCFLQILLDQSHHTKNTIINIQLDAQVGYGILHLYSVPAQMCSNFT